ncbi:MAG: DUF1549 domain-containing protein, partial [Saprospiraceae bacterium]|nr:DUF1549 domain-containing protein [Saprospiraceae bacterium]
MVERGDGLEFHYLETTSEKTMIDHLSRYFVLSLLATLLACSNDVPENVQEEMAALPDLIDYNFHVKPILSDRCFACHGPDAQKREAELRLDQEESALGLLSSGAGQAIVSGSARRSQLIRRILSQDLEFRMPPAESNLELTARDKAILLKWVKQGGKYKPHWAFTKPEQPSVPETTSSWGTNEIDQFIAARLSKYNLEPAPAAEKEQLIRRLFFDLTGLPPSLQDLDRWLEDSRSDAYELLVDSLLNLPAYGERMAVHWLDAARFADSEGYLDDFHHSFWPYRDWVIDAYNKNLPYDKFIHWQVGGDQIPNSTREQKLATAFNRNHKQNSEGGVIPEEFRVDYVADRTNTVGSAIMGLTVGCARCHDHKYDPFSQENYYQLFSFFNSTVERGDGIFSLNAVQNSGGVPNELSMNAGPVLALPDKKTGEIRKYLLQQIDTKRDRVEELAQNNADDFELWRAQQNTTKAILQAVDKATVSHLTFDDMANGTSTDLAPGANKASYWGKITHAPGISGRAIRSNAAGQFVSDGERASFERMEPFTVSFWIHTPKEFSEAHVLYNGNDRIQGYRGWDIVLDESHLHFRLNHAHPYQSLDIKTENVIPLNTWVHFVWTYDGSSNAKGMRIYRDGELSSVEIVRNHLYRSTKPYLIPEATIYKPYKGIIIGNRHYDQDFTGGLLDEVRVLNREAEGLVARYLYNKEEGLKAFKDAIENNTPQLGDFYDLFVDDKIEKKRVELRSMQAREIRTIDTV